MVRESGMKYFEVFRYCKQAKEIQFPPNLLVSKSHVSSKDLEGTCPKES